MDSVFWFSAVFSLIFFLRIRRPPRSTRTDTLFPYTTLFRSMASSRVIRAAGIGNSSIVMPGLVPGIHADGAPSARSEEHTSELQSLMRISYAVFCLKKKKNRNEKHKLIHLHTSQQDGQQEIPA